MQLKTSPFAFAIEDIATKRHLRPILADEQIHIVPCDDCMRLLWVDRAGGILESVVFTPGAMAEAVRGLLLWSKQTEAVWSTYVD